METRKEFIRKAAVLSGGMGLLGGLPGSIQKALAIDPAKGSSYLDAEHIVILMQENRSFDHSYGTLQGVRGYRDPRAIRLPDGLPVWAQTEPNGKSFLPFRLNMKGTNATWMGSLPHSWANQVDARNDGRHDKWLHAKQSRSYKDIPLTLGYYNREDLPFYYALADAFTVCDQNFCSSLTGTHANRLYLMTGTIREKQHPSSQALVLNGNADYFHEVSWRTFPERLEENQISWKIYQNEIGVQTGLDRKEYAWLSNLHCNMMEVFTQFEVRFSPSSRTYLKKLAETIPNDIKELESHPKPYDKKIRNEIAKKKKELEEVLRQCAYYTAENWKKLPPETRSIHERAFCTNAADPDYRKLESIAYSDGKETRNVEVPKGDIYHQFRKDVASGNLPAVSWIIGPQHFSDHPASPWYGAWYVSEAIDILTQNPEVWKKTIFILAYDENDGYFDHVPPFVAPNPRNPETGATSASIDPAVDFVELDMDRRNKPLSGARESPIGLGFRVPLVIASPWSRGGNVCSQVFDHTSILMFLEKFLSNKTGREIRQPEISSWRRAICGDLSSVFSPFNGEKVQIPFPDRDAFVGEIHKAQFKNIPSAFKELSSSEKRTMGEQSVFPFHALQEKGIRRACPLPYEIYVDGRMDDSGKRMHIRMASGKKIFGTASAGVPFVLYANPGTSDMRTRNYAVGAGEYVEDILGPETIRALNYHYRIDGPNGFMREFRGRHSLPCPDVFVKYQVAQGRPTGILEISVMHSPEPLSVSAVDNAYGQKIRKQMTSSEKGELFYFDTRSSHGWYDFSILLDRDPTFERRCTGRIETGEWSFTDPAMGGMV